MGPRYFTGGVSYNTDGLRYFTGGIPYNTDGPDYYNPGILLTGVFISGRNSTGNIGPGKGTARLMLKEIGKKEPVKTKSVELRLLLLFNV
jgi:hypothetical protein